MEEKKDESVNPEVVPQGVIDHSVESTRGGEISGDEKAKELDTTTPIQEKLSEIEEKQNMEIPEVVKEVAEVVIPAAATAAGDKEVKTEKVKVKKPTKSDPIIMYGDNVVMWYIET